MPVCPSAVLTQCRGTATHLYKQLYHRKIAQPGSTMHRRLAMQSATVWSGLLLVIVKLGYVPDVVIPVPPVNATVWSGALFVIVSVPPASSYVFDIPVPACNKVFT